MPATSQTLDLDLFSDELRRNPYPTYRRLRSEAPIFWSDLNQAWILSRYADVAAMLDDPRAGHWRASDSDTGDPFARSLARWLRLLDPRTGSSLRQLAAGVFRSVITSATRALTWDIAERLLADAADSGYIDVVRGFAQPIALAITARLIGVPAALTPDFVKLAEGMTGRLFGANSSDGQSHAADAAARFSAFVRLLLEEKRIDPGDDLTSALLQAQQEGDCLEDDDFEGVLVLFLFAGHENMMNFIGNAVHALVQKPDQLRLLRQNTELCGGAIEELLRYDSPVQLMEVMAEDALEIRGTLIGKGETILLCIGSANRDPERFEDPERLDLTRPKVAHLSFGLGALTCIGAALARLQGQIAISALAKRMAHPAIRSPLQWRRSPPVLRGLKSLVVSFGS